MDNLKNKNIVIGVTSSISAYKAVSIVKELRKSGANIFVIMTKNAAKLVSIREFEAASGNKVHTELFNPEFDFKDYLKQNKNIKHISLADSADIFAIVPATASIIGKIAGGIADDLLTASIMAAKAPILISPAMNVKMWENPIVQENVKKLKKLGYEFIGPEYGVLACGYKGVGRLADLNKITHEIKIVLSRKKDFENKKILVTAGATMEEIDPVRVITNKSSGKMGVMIAEEAAKRGANVALIRGINSVEPLCKLKDIQVKSSKDMFDEIKKNIKNDIIIHAAAVSDFTADKAKEKIKSGNSLNLELAPTTKILENIKKLNKKVFLVGFKAEYNVSEKELIDRAYGLLKSADADLIVANDVGKTGRGFDVDTNEVFIIDKKKKVKHIGLDFKRAVANRILDEIKRLRAL